MKWLLPLLFALLASLSASAQQEVYICNYSAAGANGQPTCELMITASAPTTAGALTLVSGGAAQTLFIAKEVQHGCSITNPTTATEQGIGAAESINLSFTTTTATAGGGTATILLEAGQSVGCGMGMSNAVTWIAATTGHKINATKW